MDHKRGFIKGFRYGSLVLFTVSLALLFAGCRKDSPEKPVELDDFIRKQECGLVGYGGYLFKYSDTDCQLSINARRRQVRMQNDDQTDYVQVVFGRMPGNGDVSSDVYIRYRVGSDEIAVAGRMEIVRSSNAKVWLWDGGRQLGVILPMGR